MRRRRRSSDSIAAQDSNAILDTPTSRRAQHDTSHCSSDSSGTGLSARTDYTYSASLSYRSISPSRKVPSPNMARRPLRSSGVEQHDTVTENVSLTTRYGLDYESDGENVSSTPSTKKKLQHRAVPLLVSKDSSRVVHSSLLQTTHYTNRVSCAEDYLRGSVLAPGDVSVQERVSRTLRRCAQCVVSATSVVLLPFTTRQRPLTPQNSQRDDSPLSTSPMMLRSRKRLGNGAQQYDHTQHTEYVADGRSNSRTTNLNYILSILTISSCMSAVSSAASYTYTKVSWLPKLVIAKLASSSLIDDSNSFVATHSDLGKQSSTVADNDVTDSHATSVHQFKYSTWVYNHLPRFLQTTSSTQQSVSTSSSVWLSTHVFLSSIIAATHNKYSLASRRLSAALSGLTHSGDALHRSEDSASRRRALLCWLPLLLALLFACVFACLTGWSYATGTGDLTDAVSSNYRRVSEVMSSCAGIAVSAASFVVDGTWYCVCGVTNYTSSGLLTVLHASYDLLQLCWNSLLSLCYNMYSWVSSSHSSLNTGVAAHTTISNQLQHMLDWLSSSVSSGAFVVTHFVQGTVSSVAATVSSGISETVFAVSYLPAALYNATVGVLTVVTSGVSSGALGAWTGIMWLWSWLVSLLYYLLGAVNYVWYSVGAILSSVTVASPATTFSDITAAPVSPDAAPSNAPLPVDELLDKLMMSEQLQQLLQKAVSGEVSAAVTSSSAQHQQTTDTLDAITRDLQRQHQLLQTQLQQLTERVARVDADTGELQQLQAAVSQLSQRITGLQEEQSHLSLEVTSCCKAAHLPRPDIEAQVSELVASILGYSGPPPSPQHLAAWITTYFATNDQMDKQVRHLNTRLEETAELMAGSQNETQSGGMDSATVEQTQQLVMAAVLQQLQQKVAHEIDLELQKQLRSEETYNSLHSTVSDRLTAALAPKLQATVDEHITKSVEKVSTDLQQVKTDLDARISEQVEETVASIVPQMVTERVSVSMPQVAALNASVRALVSDAITAYLSSQSRGTCSGTVLPMGAESSSGAVSGSLSHETVSAIVTAALAKYDADRTGLADHALESGGGSIVSTRCTEPYEVNQAQLSWLGIPLYRYSTNTPRSIIQPDRNPGQCWAFKGSQGYVVFRLVAPVRPTGFTLEHIPKELAPFGNIDSAPNNFSVWGLISESDEGVELGQYHYANGDAEPLQYFPVQHIGNDYYPFIELKINSNHGQMKYTCVYRFRVHGIRMKM